MSLQKRVIEIINNNHTDHLLKKCEIFKLSDTYQYQVCLIMDDFISKTLPHSFAIFLNSDTQDDHVTRQSSDMNVPHCNLVYRLYLIFLLYGTTGIVSFPLVNENHKLRKL